MLKKHYFSSDESSFSKLRVQEWIGSSSWSPSEQMMTLSTECRQFWCLSGGSCVQLNGDACHMSRPTGSATQESFANHSIFPFGEDMEVITWFSWCESLCKTGWCLHIGCILKLKVLIVFPAFNRGNIDYGCFPQRYRLEACW